ncbi:MAG: hypothetical protein AAGF24_01955 [Cyanobacteria bacterium P01_H01_bin.121]
MKPPTITRGRVIGLLSVRKSLNQLPSVELLEKARELGIDVSEYDDQAVEPPPPDPPTITEEQFVWVPYNLSLSTFEAQLRKRAIAPQTPQTPPAPPQ